MEVKYIDLTAQYANDEEIKQVVLDVLAGGQFILGPALGEFEKNFAGFCGVKYAVGMSSGTDALFLALKVLGIREGDEVITIPNSFVATVGAIAMTGAFPRMVDVDEDYNISAREIEKAVNEKTKAVIPVHLTGNPARMEEISRVAKKHDLFVVEDACQAVGASIGERKTGSFGDLAAFSLHPLKNLNTCGDGGIITTNSGKYYEELLLYRNHGLINRDEARFFACNCRLDSLKAAVANVQLRTVDEVTSKCNRIAGMYDEGFSGLKEYIEIPSRRKNVNQVFHTYVIQVEKRDELMEFLKGKGIETKVHYPVPIHLMEASGKYGYKKGDFPVAEKQSEKIISLPVHVYLTNEQVSWVIDCIQEFYK